MGEVDSEQDFDITEYQIKRPKRKTLIAPWKDVEEFNKVYSWIYGENATIETKELACRQMVVWKIRRANLTPASVLGTLVILEIQLKDERKTLNSTPEQIKELQILYANAFTRFFNYMSSIMQSSNMKTMYDTAKNLNMRSFVVDLRHICAHGQDMPSLDVLRGTSKYCLKWLEEFYWKSQSESMRNVDILNIRLKDQSEFEENVWKMFRFYDAALECCLKGEQKLSKKYVKGEKYIALKAYAQEKGSDSTDSLLCEIVKDLGTMVNQEKDMMDLSDIYIQSILEMKFFFASVGNQIQTDDQLELLIKHTQGLFRMLAVYGLIEDLFHSLLAIVENKNEEPNRRESASFWANQLVLGFIAFRRCKEVYKSTREEDPSKNYDLKSLNFEHTSKKVLQFYSRVGINIKTTLIFGDSVRRPWVWTFNRDFVEERLRYVNEYSVQILKNVLHLVDPQFTESEIKVFCSLLELNISNETSMDCPEISIDEQCVSDKIYTAEDVLKMVSGNDDVEMQNVTDDSGVKKYGIWSTAPDCQEWYSCPIGRLIWE